MRICVIGKYPPIQGGVSAHTYWLSRALAARGHEVHVVTNADEVEEMYRVTLEADDWPWYQPRFEQNGGSVSVYNPERFSTKTMSHIPVANPFVSRLASLSTDIVRRHDCQAILAYYYEPYGVAAWLASRWTGRPLLVKHAGSDLDRLFAVPDVATTYKEILRSADAVITQPRLMPRFLGMGVSPDRLEADVPYAVPDVFRPGGEALDIARLALTTTGGARPGRFDARRPSIGVYGKIGESKGTFDLIAALGALGREGLDFNFVAMVGEAQGDCLTSALRSADLMERTSIVPFLPNWKVPSFIRACTAVCFLERDFPVAIHGPLVPREILACGVCLVVSGEIAHKQRYQDRLVPGENVVIAEDPKDRAGLAAALRSIIEDPARAAAIGREGAKLSAGLEPPESAGAALEALVERYVRRSNRSVTESPAADGRTPAAVALDATVPDLRSFLERRGSRLVEECPPCPDAAHVFDAAIHFCDFAAGRIDGQTFGDDAPKLAAALQYLKARLAIARDPVGGHDAAFAAGDRLLGEPVTEASTRELRPLRGNAARIEEFAYDVSALFPLVGPSPAMARDADVDLSTVRMDPLIVLFHRSPNSITRELRIDRATRALFDRCDGTLTTAQIVDGLSNDFGAQTPAARADLSRQVVSALERLYRLGVIVFGERRPGWGWTGGERSATPASERVPEAGLGVVG